MPHKGNKDLRIPYTLPFLRTESHPLMGQGNPLWVFLTATLRKRRHFVVLDMIKVYVHLFWTSVIQFILFVGGDFNHYPKRSTICFQVVSDGFMMILCYVFLTTGNMKM